MIRALVGAHCFVLEEVGVTNIFVILFVGAIRFLFIQGGLFLASKGRRPTLISSTYKGTLSEH